jgi:uncharacterized protein YggE
MKKQALWIVSLVVIGAMLAACQGAPVSGAGGQSIQRTITAVGQGQVFLAPDLARIYIGVHSQAESVSDALADNNAKAQAIADALAAMGVDTKDVQTSSFNIYPQQQYGPNGEILGTTLYNVDNTVNVTVRDLSKLGGLLDAVITSGANSINGIEFDVQNKEEALKNARKLAIDNAKAQAAEIADAAGVTLGSIVSVNISNLNQGGPIYDKAYAQGASQVPISAGQLALTVEASVTYDIK